MNVSKLAPYAKAVAAVAGAVVATATCVADGTLTVDEIAVVMTAWGTALAVFQVPNKSK